jgi:hypothetical protein
LQGTITLYHFIIYRDQQPILDLCVSVSVWPAGTLPDWLGNLANLEVLNLGSQAGTTEETGLHGTIPAGIGRLSKLRELNLVSY